MFKALFYGNYDVHLIDNIKYYLARFLPPTTKLEHTEAYETQVRDLKGSYIFRAQNDLPNEVNHVIVNYYQIGPKDTKMSLVSNMIELFWGNLFYEELRTIKQLGYVVNAAKTINENVMVIS